MSEAVRLVIWDLDETFWRGTLTEGGIQEYVAYHHEVVIELARRGIVSSICSKNDPAVVMPLLREKGILDYFVFPSISWEPKGFRLSRLIETIGLRPATVMFIDDNPNNRAEALSMVPSLQVEDDKFIASILEDGRFVGKPDNNLSRLSQYKLLEQKKKDEETSTAGNEEFLKSCHIQVYVDFNIEANIDRAVELINRTNQLNYTKRRLPEDGNAARVNLLNELQPFDTRAGLIRVWDKYGDYGFVGFFLTRAMRNKIVTGASNTRLIHFCFSCRTLGMLIEQWVYSYLGCPELEAKGECLTELEIGRKIDWINQANDVAAPQSARKYVAPKIVVVGGCEAHSIGAYFTHHASEVDVVGNYAANGLFARVNSSAVLLDMAERLPQDFEAEANTLGIPLHLETMNIFATHNEGSLYFLNLGLDRSYHHLFRHRDRGWIMMLTARMNGAPHLTSSQEEMIAHLDAFPHFYDEEKRKHVLSVNAHFLENYEMVQPDLTPESRIREVIERIPRGSKLILTANHHQSRPYYPSEEVVDDPHQRGFVELLRRVASDYDYVGIVPTSDAIENPSDMREADHYDRQVYFRLATRALAVFEELPARCSTPPSRRRVLLDLLKREIQLKKLDRHEIQAIVDAAFNAFLRRPPENSHYVDAILAGKLSVSDFISGVGRSREFSVKWIAVNPETGQVETQAKVAAE